MFGPDFKVLRHPEAFRQAGRIRTVGLQILEQLIVSAAVTVEPVINGACQFPFLASSMELNQARMICPATVGISSS